jgi:hypothetical protein
MDPYMPPQKQNSMNHLPPPSGSPLPENLVPEGEASPATSWQSPNSWPQQNHAHSESSNLNSMPPPAGDPVIEGIHPQNAQQQMWAHQVQFVPVPQTLRMQPPPKKVTSVTGLVLFTVAVVVVFFGVFLFTLQGRVDSEFKNVSQSLVR